MTDAVDTGDRVRSWGVERRMSDRELDTVDVQK